MVDRVCCLIVQVYLRSVRNVLMVYVSNAHLVSMLIVMGYVLREQACYVYQQVVLIIQTVRQTSMIAHNTQKFK